MTAALLSVMSALRSRFGAVAIAVAMVIAMTLVSYALGHQRGYQQGYGRAQKKCDADQTAVAMQNARTQAAQAEASVRVVTQYVNRVRIVRERGNNILNEVPLYVPSDPAACALPGGWRVLHDAAAEGEFPDAARRADAPVVTAEEAAAAVAGNYASCHDTAEQLSALQGWLRAQHQVSQ